MDMPDGNTTISIVVEEGGELVFNVGEPSSESDDYGDSDDDWRDDADWNGLATEDVSVPTI